MSKPQQRKPTEGAKLLYQNFMSDPNFIGDEIKMDMDYIEAN